MKILKFIGIGLVVVILIFLIAGAIAPKDFDAKRSTVINAPADVVYKNITSLEAYNKWDPFGKKDPNAVVTMEGTDGAIGNKRSWKGNKEVGEGSMTLTKLESNKYVEYNLDFMKPREMHSIAYMEMEPAEGGQKVSWGFKGKMPYPMNAMLLFMSMENMMAKDFDAGLASLKALSESEGSTTSATTYEVQETDWTAKECLATAKKTLNAKDIGAFLGENYPKMGAAIGKAGAKPGLPFAVYYTWDDKTMSGEMAAAIPYEGAKGGKIASKEFQNLNIPASKAYKVDYYGWYDKLMPAYDALNAKLKGMGMEHPDMTIEEYVNDPMTEKDTAKLHTVIYYLVKQPVATK